MSKQRSHRRPTPVLIAAPTEVSVEQDQDDECAALRQEKMALYDTLARTVQEHDTLRTQVMEQEEALRVAAKYISELEAAMLTTQNMPGGEIISPTSTETEHYAGVSAPRPAPTTQVHRNGDLGPCVRDVVHVRDLRSVSVISVTVDTDLVYEIEFRHGRAKVPVVIADYIHRENPGDCMRSV